MLTWQRNPSIARPSAPSDDLPLGQTSAIQNMANDPASPQTASASESRLRLAPFPFSSDDRRLFFTRRTSRIGYDDLFTNSLTTPQRQLLLPSECLDLVAWAENSAVLKMQRRAPEVSRVDMKAHCEMEIAGLVVGKMGTSIWWLAFR